MNGRRWSKFEAYSLKQIRRVQDVIETRIHSRRLQHRAGRDKKAKAGRLVRIWRNDPSLGSFLFLPRSRSMEIIALFPGRDGRNRFPPSGMALLRRFRNAGIVQRRIRSRKNRDRGSNGIQAKGSPKGSHDRVILGSDRNRDSDRGIFPGVSLLKGAGVGSHPLSNRSRRTD